MRALYTLLFVIGTLSTVVFGVWFIAGILYVFDESISNPGLIAYVPKWVFLFSPLSLLWKKREVQETIELIVFLFEKKELPKKE
jgi:hypothetical protein